MRKSKTIKLILALVWVVSTLPYFASNLVTLHGNHKISSKIRDGKLLLIFHHDNQQLGKERNNHHHNHHADHKNSSHEPISQHSQEDHVENIFTLVATYQLRDAYKLTKSLAFIPYTKIFTTIVDALSLQAPKIYIIALDVSSEFVTSIRTVILHL